ncbi:MAG TPA: hypothetical protein VJ994_07165 [Paracoccaceae bacterium]|nr:hypothetical protein [Paracoccaceae bacterium]
MIRRTSAAAALSAAAAAPARAFEAAPDRLAGFHVVEPGAGELVAAALDLLTPFGPVALVAVVALYVVAETRLFAAR